MTTIAANSLPSRTGIGSLPHHNVDAALAYSFRMGIPFLPQIPIRNPWEYMIAQALEGLPGLQIDGEGGVVLNLDIWASRTGALARSLSEAFERPHSERGAFEAFEPGSAVSSSWQPFVWELAERAVKGAKVQIAGPMTAQWALREAKTRSGEPIERESGLATQIYRLVLARAISMIRRLQSLGVAPLIYLDEPGLYGLNLQSPRHLLGLQELKLMIQTLRKEGATVGLHCCSNTDWKTILSLGLDVLSIDASLSLESLLRGEGARLVAGFIEGGGRLSLGVIPTGRPALLRSLRVANVHELYTQVIEIFSAAWEGNRGLVERAIGEAICTPACGLALHSVTDAELIQELLIEFDEHRRSWANPGARE